MTARRVYVLLALAIAVIATALWVSSQRHLPRDVDIGNKLFAALNKNQLTEIDLSKAGMKRTVTLKVNRSEWTVGERDGYPADASKVRALVLGVADLKIIEEKTSDPANYSALGVEDIAKPAASGTQIDLKTATGSDSLIVGHVSGGQTAFVRKPGSARSYLVAP
ncbi:MAG: DUF4340 domain-containing protein, partial [Steroidobacterales bacterium]